MVMQYLFLYVLQLLIVTKSVDTQAIQNGRSYVELVLRTQSRNYVTSVHKFRGILASSGKTMHTGGRLLQLNEHTICSPRRLNDSSYEWVAFIKIPKHIRDDCQSSLERMVKLASQKGANAVIFDVTGNVSLQRKLEDLPHTFNRPVVFIAKRTSKKMIKILRRKKKPYIRINTTERNFSTKNGQEKEKKSYLDMAIFLAFFVLISSVCLLLVIKIKCRHRRKKISMTRQAIKALQKMEVKTWQCDEMQNNNTDTSCAFDLKTCTVCLEELHNGQNTRVLPCQHEYHQQCIDPWLISNFTCPLCMYTIIDSKKKKCKLQRRTSLLRTILYGRSNSAGDESNTNHSQTLLVTTQNTLPNTVPEPNTVRDNESFISQQSSEEHVLEPYRFRWCPRHAKRHSCAIKKNLPSEQSETECLKVARCSPTKDMSNFSDSCENLIEGEFKFTV